VHEPGDVDRVGVVADVDVVPDIADADQPGDRQMNVRVVDERGELELCLDGQQNWLSIRRRTMRSRTGC
jgi:hypothetical protein